MYVSQFTASKAVATSTASSVARSLRAGLSAPQSRLSVNSPAMKNSDQMMRWLKISAAGTVRSAFQNTGNNPQTV